MRAMDSYIGLLVLIGIIGSAVSNANYCPPKEELSYCYCRNAQYYVDPGTRLQCSYMSDTQALYHDVQKIRGYPMDYFFFERSNFSHLPGGLFSGTNITNMRIVNSSLGNHGTSNISPFDGLENTLKEVKIQMCSDPSSWFLPEMKNLTSLKTFIVTTSRLDFVGHFLTEIKSLENIEVSYSGVNRIHPQAFQDHTNLKSAVFSGNNIPYLVRTMFPNPAPKLESLGFGDNKLFTLNENMFENMPALKFLDISRNKFKNFEISVFKPVWKQLDLFAIALNPFICDCTLVELQQEFISGNYPPNRDFEFATCRKPGDRNETFLPDLDGKSMHC